MMKLPVLSPLVSIIVPTYNSEITLDNCIRSAISQSYYTIEVIIVDDGSTDSSRTIAENYAAMDSRIVLVKKERNEGLVLARKSGIEIARGKYIQYLDADDTLCEGAIEFLVSKAEESNADIVVAPFYFCIDSKKEKSLFFDFEELSGIDYLKAILTWKAYWSVWSKFHLSSLYHRGIDRPNISLGEDVILSTQLLFYSKKVVTIDKEIINYNFTPSSMSHPDNFDDSKYEDFKNYVNWINNFLDRKGLLLSLRKEIAYFNLKTALMRLHWKKIEDVDKEMTNIIADMKLFPDLLELLTRRERKIVAVYRFSRWLGYLNLKRYKKQGKL